MTAGGGDFQCSFRGLLTAHLAKVDAVVIVVNQNLRKVDTDWSGRIFRSDRSDEVDSEMSDEHGTDMGSISYALSKALSEADDKTTYRDMFARADGPGDCFGWAPLHSP